MHRLFLLALLFAAVPAARAQTAEEAVTAALDRLVALARAGDDAALAGRLACYTGIPGPGTLHLRPCLASADSARTAAVAAHFRATYGTDTAYVLDWLASGEEEGHAVHRTQVKVRSTEPPGLVEYRFVALGDSLLLADAGAERLVPPELPPPASAREEAERTMQELFNLTTPADGPEAAARMACPDLERRTIRRCDYADEDDRVRVDALRRRLQTFLRRAGPTGWGFAGYRTKDEREGTWHLLQIDYLDAEAPGGRATAYAAFIHTGDGLALGDLAEWPR